MNGTKIKFMLILLMVMLLADLVHSEDKKQPATERTTNWSKEKQDKHRFTDKKKQSNRSNEFIPSEKIQADSSVSFPVDI